MKLYKTKSGLIIEENNLLWVLDNEDWDQFVNDDNLHAKLEDIIHSRKPASDRNPLNETELLAPLHSQEIWASGVTYSNSKLARQAESKEAGGGAFYANVYVADRPELFFKASPFRTSGPGGTVRIRADSTWDVPEPELTLMITSSGKIVGYTIGNDMSSRSIEGENPLYLPQAKTYDGSASVGPCIWVPDSPPASSTTILLQILRTGKMVFEGTTTLDQMKRKPEELASWLYRECSFPNGCLLMTGTGVIPPPEFTLQSGDEIRITIEPIGTLINRVE